MWTLVAELAGVCATATIAVEVAFLAVLAFRGSPFKLGWTPAAAAGAEIVRDEAREIRVSRNARGILAARAGRRHVKIAAIQGNDGGTIDVAG